MTLRLFIESVSRSLGDYDAENAGNSFIHWSEADLLRWYNEAMCLVATYKPQDFVKTKILRLRPGTTQFACCNNIGSTVALVKKDGTHIKYLRTSTAKITQNPWRGRKCSSTAAGYEPDNVIRLDDSGETFEVHPPVPEVGGYYVQIRCVQSPEPKTSAELDEATSDCRYDAPARQWMLFSALSGQTDAAMINAAQIHYKAFWDMLGIQQKSMERYQSKQTALLQTTEPKVM